jgi:GT2 family glycosyltransferase
MMAPLVYILVLNWNNYGDTKECLDSLKMLRYPNYKVVLIDNASTDGSGHALSVEYPEHKVVCNEVNLGYAGGNNMGIKLALRNGADYILILNNDVIIDSPTFLESTVEFMEKRLDVGILGPRILSWQDGTVVREYSSSLWWTMLERIIGPRGGNRHAIGKTERRGQYVSRVSGCAILIRSLVFERIGLFNESYFMYGEETELCLRALLADIGIFCYHKEAVLRKSSDADTDYLAFSSYYKARNRFYMISDNLSGVRAFLLLVSHFMGQAKHAVKWLLSGRPVVFRHVISGVLDSLNGRRGQTKSRD